MSWRMILVMFVIAMVSCRESKPSIDGLRWWVIYRDDGKRRYEELSLAVFPQEVNGKKDLAILKVSPDGSHLVWKADPTQWVWSSDENEGWFAVLRLVPLEGDRLPSGQWTVTLISLAGHQDTQSFRLDPKRPRLHEINWPRLRVQEGHLVLEGPHEEVTLFFLDEEGLTLDSGQYRSGAAVEADYSTSWEAWFPLEDVSRGIRLGPYLWNGESPMN